MATCMEALVYRRLWLALANPVLAEHPLVQHVQLSVIQPFNGIQSIPELV